MATLKAIRRRISSVRNIQQITNAMRMVSAARLRRAQEAAEAARPYAEKLEAVLHNLATQSQTLAHPLLTKREENKIDLMLYTSDRGLCGSFNSSLIREAEAFIGVHPAQEVTVSCVGRRGFDHFRRREAPMAEEHINLGGKYTSGLAHDIGVRMTERFITGESDGFYILYARFRSALVQIPTLDQVLPIVPKVNDDDLLNRERSSSTLPQEQDDSASPLDYLYEPTAQGLLSRLLTRYVDMLLYRAMLESVASEHGARMTAMESATNNAVEMIDTLTLDMNRARQASITRELLEIVATGESLK
jgi:F-type H+-transporting ATPase subunit gamma